MLFYWYRAGHLSQDMSWIIIVIYFKEEPCRVNSSATIEKELNIQIILTRGSVNIGH